MAIQINENICFVENKDNMIFDFELTNTDFRDEYDIRKINVGDVFKDKKINITYNASPIFSKDTSAKNSYGVRVSEDFDDISYTPFDDAIPNIEKTRDITEYDTISFIRYYNAKTIHEMQHSISILGFFEETSGKLTTLNKINGIKAELMTSSTDSRERAVVIKTNFSNNSKNKTEPFTDIVFENDYTDNRLQRNFVYETININGKNYQTLSFGEDKKSFINRETNKVMYVSDDLLAAEPFYDNNTEIVEISMSLGFDIDKSNNIGTDSIAYLGEIN